MLIIFFFTSHIDKTRRESQLSLANSNHFYEEVFSELIDGLKKTEEESPYERISLTLGEAELVPGLDAPFVPPRRSSIREDSRPIKKPVPAKRPIIRTKSPEVFREMFNLPEEPSLHGSLDNLNEQMLQLSTEDVSSLSPEISA